jgi:hypothetical protein
MRNKFERNLTEVIKASSIQKTKELWDIEGIIKNKSNQKFKFDLRPLIKFKGDTGKGGSFKSKADKMVFDIKDQWIIVDTEELFNYLQENNLKKVQLEDLLSKLEWNIILPK